MPGLGLAIPDPDEIRRRLATANPGMSAEQLEAMTAQYHAAAQAQMQQQGKSVGKAVGQVAGLGKGLAAGKGGMTNAEINAYAPPAGQAAQAAVPGPSTLPPLSTSGPGRTQLPSDQQIFEPEKGGGGKWGQALKALSVISYAVSDAANALQGPGRQTNQLGAAQQREAEREEGVRREARETRQAGLQERGMNVQEQQLALAKRREMIQGGEAYLNMALKYAPYVQRLPDDERVSVTDKFVKDGQEYGLGGLGGAILGTKQGANFARMYKDVLGKHPESSVILQEANLRYESMRDGGDKDALDKTIKWLDARVVSIVKSGAIDAVEDVVGVLSSEGETPTYTDVLTGLRARSPAYVRALSEDKDLRQLVDNRLASLGITPPSLGAKVAETKALEGVKKGFEKPPEVLGRESYEKKKGELKAEAEVPPAAKPPTLSEVGAIRDDYFKASEPFRFVQPQYQHAMSIEKTYDNSKATKADLIGADMQLTYVAAILFDQRTGVKEGEQKAIAGSGTLSDEVQKWRQYVLGGGALPPDVRRGILSRIKDVYRTRAENQQKIEGEYTGIAKRHGIDPRDVLAGVPERGAAAAGGIPRQGADAQAVYKQLRDSGLTKEQALEQLKKRGF